MNPSASPSPIQTHMNERTTPVHSLNDSTEPIRKPDQVLDSATQDDHLPRKAIKSVTIKVNEGTEDLNVLSAPKKSALKN